MRAFVLVLCVACGIAARREAAKDLYTEQLHACVDNADTKPAAEACILAIQGEWSDAGAKAAIVDGGHE